MMHIINLLPYAKEGNWNMIVLFTHTHICLTLVFCS